MYSWNSRMLSQASQLKAKYFGLSLWYYTCHIFQIYVVSSDSIAILLTYNNRVLFRRSVTWNKASGCNYYVIYRKASSSSWKKIAMVKSNVLKYTDKVPVMGVKNTYTVKSYYSKTKVYGKYNKTGVSVNVPSASTNKTSITQAYKKVLKAVEARKNGYRFTEFPDGGEEFMYFLYDADKDGTKELFVGALQSKARPPLLFHVYTCKKTSNGYIAKQISGTLKELQLSSTGIGLYENIYLHDPLSIAIYYVTIQNNKLIRGNKPLYFFKDGEVDGDYRALFCEANPFPTCFSINDYSELNKL